MTLVAVWPGVMLKLATVTLMTWNGAVMVLFVDLYVLLCYILYKEFEYLGRTAAADDDTTTTTTTTTNTITNVAIL